MRAALVLSLLLVGCATSRHSPSDDRAQLEAARQQLARDERELNTAKAEGQPVDCRRATQLADNICMLAERICVLVTRLPPDPTTTAHCTDARTRCKSARDRVQVTCKS